MKKLSSLSPNKENPRKVDDERLAAFKAALIEFGDISGIVFNRRTKQLVGGHQRVKLFDPSNPLFITHTYKKPTRTGTVAEGYTLVGGERFTYREVDWDEIKESAANMAANRGAGDWDEVKLDAALTQMDEFGYDVNLTLFTEAERIEFEQLDFDPPAPKKKNQKAKFHAERSVTCPKCACTFAVDA